MIKQQEFTCGSYYWIPTFSEREISMAKYIGDNRFEFIGSKLELELISELHKPLIEVQVPDLVIKNSNKYDAPIWRG